MTASYDSIFAGNRAWATAQTAEDPEYFGRLSRQHTPHTLFIGCSDASELRLHGIVYDIHDGLLRDLGVTMDAPPGTAAVTERAAAAVLAEEADAPAVAPGARATRGGNDDRRVLSRA